MKIPPFRVKTKVWVYQGGKTKSSNAAAMKGAWHFVTINKVVSEEIRKNYMWPRRGFGSMPVSVTVGKTAWKTSIFPDKKSGGYLLPIKKEIRVKESLKINDTISVILKILNI